MVGVKAAAQCSWRLDKVSHLVQQRIVHNFRAANLALQARNLRGDNLAPPFWVQQDIALSQRAGILPGIVQADLTGLVKPQPARHPTGQQTGI